MHIHFLVVDNFSINTAKLDRVISSCAGFNFRKVSRVVTQHFDEILKPSKLSITQFTVLVAVAKVRAIAVSDLAKILLMDRTTLTRNLKPLKKEGYLDIEPGQDKRTRIISLTSDGELALAKAMPLWEQAQKDIVEFLGEPRWQTLLAQLSEVAKLPRSS
ncbi:MAG: MarR family winged helix-turn-helix transcriptional regulator [Cyanophyceae cyanobacterium]